MGDFADRGGEEDVNEVGEDFDGGGGAGPVGDNGTVDAGRGRTTGPRESRLYRYGWLGIGGTLSEGPAPGEVWELGVLAIGDVGVDGDAGIGDSCPTLE